MIVQSIFSNNTYDKPFFVVYVNTSVFAISLIPMTIRYVRRNGFQALRAGAIQAWHEQKYGKSHLKPALEDDDITAGERLLPDGENGSLEMLDQSQQDISAGAGGSASEEKLSFRETAILSLEFSMLWFIANYFASACLEYTSVGSVTILTSTSSIWTLIFCALMRVEGFTARKLMGVLASLVGVILISTVDLSGSSDENRGSFPHKSLSQIAIGDAMAFVSAIIYGLYVTVMKRRVGNEDRVYMPLFFGLVGVYNLLLLWPLFFIFHFTNIEPVCWSIVGPRLLELCSLANERCLVCNATNWKDLGCDYCQLAFILCQRSFVGICHAPDNSFGRHRRPVPYDPAISHRGDDSVPAVRQHNILDWGGCRVRVVLVRQPREPRGRGHEGSAVPPCAGGFWRCCIELVSPHGEL